MNGTLISERLAPKSSARVAWFAWALAGLSGALTALGLFVLYLNGYFAPFFEDSLGVDVAVAVTYPVAGAVIASRRPGNTIGWIFCTIGLLHGAAVFAGEYAKYVLVTEPGVLPGGVPAAWLGTWIWVPGVVLNVTFLLVLFPDGRPPSPRWWPLALFAAGVAALGSFVLAVLPWEFLDPGVPGENPFEIGGILALEDELKAFFIVSVIASSMLAVLSLIMRFRRARGTERQQIKWFAYASGLYVLTVIVPVPAITNLQVLTATFLPVAAGVAILKHRLYDIDLVINRTLVFGALSACVAGIYVLVVGYLGALFRMDSTLPISLVATGVVAVLFAPLRERLQRAVNRLMYGERDEPYTVLARLGQRLEATLEPDAVLPAVARTVAEALKLPYAAVEVERNGELVTAAATGAPVADPMRLPLAYGGAPVGRLVLGLRAGEQGFSSTDRRLLDDLARQIGVAVHAARLTDEALRLSADLQRSRERLVAAREEERRRLRRDLHDGLGPQLASLTMRAEAARDLVPIDPARASDVLAGLIGQAQEAVADVRRLVYALRPPTLDALGLVGAIRAQAAYGEHGGLRISIVAPDTLPPLPAAIEVAAYRIVTEALTNVARHAGARIGVVRLGLNEEAGALHLEVEDDGRGITADHATGVGLHSMRERAEELGGTLAVGSGPAGGTLVRACLPCRPADAGHGGG